MEDLPYAGIVLLVLLGSAMIGQFIRPLLHEQHRGRETFDIVQLVNTMLVTFAALVLGLLTASVKSSFDGTDDYMRGLAAQIIRLDTELREYGTAADTARALLRRYTAAAISSTWVEEPPVPGDSGNPGHSLATDVWLESSSLGAMLDRIEREIRDLAPPDDYHHQVQSDCIARFQQLLDARWRLIGHAHGSLASPFYVVLVFWLAIVFANLGLSAPRNALTYVTIGLAALSIASVIFVLRDLDAPFTGLIAISSRPMHDALAHLLR